MTKPRRVLILGGGCGGVAAAWALSRTEESRRAFDVTLVQSGWRLGGKGATGRDPGRSFAVLEHGLHLWLGFYRKAFGMIADVYSDWEAPRAGPQRSIDAAFSPVRDVALCGGSEDRPEIWRMRFPEVAGVPWDHDAASPPSWTSVAATWARRLPDALVDVPEEPWSRARIATLIGLGAAIARGLAGEHVEHGRAAWDRMDRMDLRAWLRKHGASEEEADAPPVRALYDLGFAYPEGSAGSGAGAAAAGTALRILLQIFGAYRGAPFWRMNAGMGDTVFAPAFEVLRARGVRFRFFHHLRRLRVAGRRIARVELDVQAESAETYEPLVRVGSVRAWPGAPRREHLGSVAPGELEGDVTSSLSGRELADIEDYDDVVLAIPATAHRHFAQELIDESPRYRKMVANTRGVATIAAQWWLSRTPSQLGWTGDATILTGLSGLFRTWANLSEVIDAEGWTERPSSLAYFCNVAPPELQRTTDKQAASAWVAAAVPQWASSSLARAWPASAAAERFDEGSLAAPEGGSRWAAQYARANVADWERYILSLPGTIEHRLAPDESGFENLFLAGDWTKNDVNGGSVEAAVSSGIAAATAILRRS